MQLSLQLERWSKKACRWKAMSGAHAYVHHVRCLWRTEKEVRCLLWMSVRSELQLQELQLGGESVGQECPVDDEELAMLCCKGGVLVRKLTCLLLHFAKKLSDEGLRTLAEAGCGSMLASLTLCGVCSCGHLHSTMWWWSQDDG